MPNTLLIEGNKVLVEGTPQFLKAVEMACSFVPTGALWRKLSLARQGKFVPKDYITLYSERSRHFPTGLLLRVKKECAEFTPVISGDFWQPLSKVIPDDFDLTGITLRPYQIKGIQKLLLRGRGVLRVATNGGKTEIAAAVLNHAKRKAIYIVTDLELVEQTIKRFKKRLPGMSIGILQGDNIDIEGVDVIVASVQTLAKKYRKRAFKKVLDAIDIVLLDEVHRITTAKTWYKACRAFKTKNVIGMSATPFKRQIEGSQLHLEALCGPIVYDISNKYLIAKGYSTPVDVRVYVCRHPLEYNRLHWVRDDVYNTVIRYNQKRMKFISKVVLANWESGGKKGTLILTRNVDHVKAIVAELGLHGIRAAAFFGDMKNREKVLQRFRDNKIKCVVSTPILGTGVDIENIHLLVMASPVKAEHVVTQYIGRGVRLAKGKTQVVVADILDANVDYFERQFDSRKESYSLNEFGFTYMEARDNGNGFRACGNR